MFAVPSSRIFCNRGVGFSALSSFRFFSSSSCLVVPLSIPKSKSFLLFSSSSFFQQNLLSSSTQQTKKMSAEPTPEELQHASENIVTISKEVEAAREEYKQNHDVRLVAVSKLKDFKYIQACYDIGYRNFGENYVQEMVDKAGKLPKDINWHFIGTLQRNKVRILLKGVPNLALMETVRILLKGVPNLALMETVTSTRLADEVQKQVAKLRESGEREGKLRIFVQVNTSGEDTKGGILPEECTDVVSHIVTNCPDLDFGGLMTIGRPNAPEDQPDFVTLISCRKEVASALKKEENEVELSMGMSADFKQAIKFGSTNVRVGSTIFGARPPFKPKN